jgi:hypothetical protein
MNLVYRIIVLACMLSLIIGYVGAASTGGIAQKKTDAASLLVPLRPMEPGTKIR